MQLTIGLLSAIMSATHRAEWLSCACMGFRPEGISGVGHTGNQ